MTLNQLKVFYQAAKRGNLTLAAEDLFITQPAVTKSIQRLQEYYDVKLMNRFGKKLFLTDVGEVLFEIAEKIFDLEKHVEERINEFKSQKMGHIRIHACESFGDYYFPVIMNRFCKDYPQVKISVSIFPTKQIIENITELECDIGFISYTIENDRISTQELVEDQLVLIVPPRHRITKIQNLSPSDLESESIIVHELESTPFKVIQSYIEKYNITISTTLELSGNRAIKRAVESNLGIALISRKIAEEEIQNGQLIALPLPGEIIKRKYFLATHKEKYISDVLQNLINFSKEWSKNYSARVFKTYQ